MQRKGRNLSSSDWGHTSCALLTQTHLSLAGIKTLKTRGTEGLLTLKRGRVWVEHSQSCVCLLRNNTFMYAKTTLWGKGYPLRTEPPLCHPLLCLLSPPSIPQHPTPFKYIPQILADLSFPPFSTAYLAFNYEWLNPQILRVTTIDLHSPACVQSRPYKIDKLYELKF